MANHICLVAHSVTFETQESCDSHYHIGRRELDELVAEGSIQPVDGAREFAKDDEGREPDYVLEWLIPWRVLRYKREIPYRGSSAKCGWYLAQELREHRKWAQTMVGEMRPCRKKKSKTKLLPPPREKMRVLDPGYGPQKIHEQHSRN